MSAKLILEFGFLVPPFRTQLERQGFRLPRRHIADEANQALSMLCMAGLITERQREAGRRKLVRRIIAAMKPIVQRAPTPDRAERKP